MLVGQESGEISAWILTGTDWQKVFSMPAHLSHVTSVTRIKFNLMETKEKKEEEF